MTLSSSEPRRRSIAVALAWCGAIIPFGSGIHKFYLGQPGWGLTYLLLSWTPIPHIACALEGAWLLGRPPEFFGAEPTESATPAKPATPIDPTQVNALGVALRELDGLRQEGLISEAEFEQKRRQLLDQVG
ncbi:membrane protein [Leptolyngbya sp. BL0902]|uniref:NINE protein n=1 Tax=Leptolyngbya sp. BL0902 TaxID=1115757 RepID=UPI0018E732AC|nr:NINE protein [Leptolyngbya sp. BL0902]QQE66596.1 membrane protein [Leptolyngbya sp. BL0902]